MDIQTFISAALLGAVEGLTEFIPVSSTGHLILIIDIIGFNAPPGKVFEVCIQLGAISAVCWLYRQKLWNIARTLPFKRESQIFTLNILLAFLPAVIAGMLAHDFIKTHLFNPTVVATALLVGGIIILIVERLPIKDKYIAVEKFPPVFALFIGCCQTLAMIPGLSRSGATIIGAMLLGANRKSATEFSFFLAIPTMLGAAVYDLYKNYHLLSSENYAVIGVGFIFAFAMGLLVVKNVIALISKYGFGPFGWYRVALGAGMLLWLSF